MLGIEDFWIWSAYLGCILSTLVCVVYGVITWNKGGDESPKPDDVKWAEDEDKIGDEL